MVVTVELVSQILFYMKNLMKILLAPRSGLAAKFGIASGGIDIIQSIICINTVFLFSIGGVVDADYRGNVGVILFNHNDSDFISTI